MEAPDQPLEAPFPAIRQSGNCLDFPFTPAECNGVTRDGTFKGLVDGSVRRNAHVCPAVTHKGLGRNANDVPSVVHLNGGALLHTRLLPEVY